MTDFVVTHNFEGLLVVERFDEGAWREWDNLTRQATREKDPFKAVVVREEVDLEV